MADNVQITDLSQKGIPEGEARLASKWIAKAFAQARMVPLFLITGVWMHSTVREWDHANTQFKKAAEPALAIFFGTASYKDNVEMHETFWASHLNQAAASGHLLGARDTGTGEWRGFRVFFLPGSSGKRYRVEASSGDGPPLGFGEDWDRFLELTGKDAYMARIAEWGRLTSATQAEMNLDINTFFTTSIIVVDPSHQRSGIGHRLDQTARSMIQTDAGTLFVRCHEYTLGFYLAQGYRVLASPTYTMGEVKPFKVHFLRHDCQ